MLEGEVGDPTREQRRVLGVIDRNARRLMRLVGDLLVVARADAGRLGLELDAADLGEIASECTQAARPAAAQAGIALSVEVERAAVRGDRSRLAQVVDNLLSNAVKFTPAGGRVRVAVRRAGERVLVEVRDSGIGIPVAEQDRLFERFYRTSAAIDGAVPGTGLGLAISGMIVEAHGGRIDVRSDHGRGATFRVELPAAALAAVDPGTAAQG
jgi:signal transduction histidine kinase